mmetsp:Transcript_5432/g.19115  ORF Transcript_5432/g.19115 Transcript_5432/m.19115 type:complete len:101 (-) Transcript_5432:1299-1601(-)
MLPILEDLGLAERTNQGRVSVQGLLAWSSVCGVGLDTVPVEGKSSTEEIRNLYLDIASMAHRLGKPLSCRILPMRGLKEGEIAEFPGNPYLCSCAVLPIN